MAGMVAVSCAPADSTQDRSGGGNANGAAGGVSGIAGAGSAGNEGGNGGRMGVGGNARAGAGASGSAMTSGAGMPVAGTAGKAGAGGAGSAGSQGGAAGGVSGMSLAGMSGGASGSPMAMGGSAGIAKPARILCVGDSITEQKNSWIFPMQDKLKARTCGYRFLGYDASPYNGAYATKPGYESKRIAAGGFSTRGILNLIKDKGLPDAPDVFVEYLGVNNVYGGFIDGKYNPNVSGDAAGSFIADNKEFIALVRAKNPRAIFILMKIENNALPQIDKAIDEVVKTENKPESPVLAAGTPSDVETVDGIHPSAAGAVTLAGPVSFVLLDVLVKAGVCD